MSVNVLVQGGLGNQLFQVAWAYYLSYKFKLNVNLNMKMAYEQKQHFGINFTSLLGELQSLPISKKKIVTFDNDFLSKIVRFLLRKIKVHSIPNFLLFDYGALTNQEYCEAMMKCPYHYGYFQFTDAAICATDFFRSCIFKKYKGYIHSISDEISGCVGIHIRRGDFVTSGNKLHTASSIKYIKNAMAKFNYRNFLVFSDHIEWCKKELSWINSVTDFSDSSAIEDFIGLMLCKDYILSGSTFSWWAAILNRTINTKVIIPNSETLFMSEVSNQKIGWKYERL